LIGYTRLIPEKGVGFVSSTLSRVSILKVTMKGPPENVDKANDHCFFVDLLQRDDVIGFENARDLLQAKWITLRRQTCVCVCERTYVCVCVCERTYVCVCVCVCDGRS
jgi:hypothetical protein